MKNKEPICLQFGAMKSGTTFLSNIVKDFSNAKVENISISSTSDKILRINTDYYSKTNSYLRRNLYDSNNFLLPLINKTSSPIIIIIRDPMERFLSHINHHVVKMYSLNLKYSKYISLSKISKNKFEIKLDLKNYKNLNLSEITPISKGLYFNILNPILKNTNEERILFIKTNSLNKISTYQKINQHIKKYNSDFILDCNKIPIEKKENTKENMKDKLQKNMFFKKIPNFVTNISDKDLKFLKELFYKQEQKMQKYESYKNII